MQNKIQVEVSVKFESGATVTLAKDQMDAVVGFINHMLFGTVVEKTVTKKIRHAVKSRWTAQEVAMVREAMSLPAGKQRSQAYRQVARATRRAMSSISNKAWQLRKEGSVTIKKDGYTPLHSLSSLLG